MDRERAKESAPLVLLRAKRGEPLPCVPTSALLRRDLCQATPCHMVPTSMTKRYFTSELTVRSNASLIWSALMIS